MYGPLQDMCGADHWSVSLIDLRQTASEDSDPRMLAAAMQAIEACRFGAFVCLLGAKYGHVLTAVPAESARSLESKPWLALPSLPGVRPGPDRLPQLLEGRWRGALVNHTFVCVGVAPQEYLSSGLLIPCHNGTRGR